MINKVKNIASGIYFTPFRRIIITLFFFIIFCTSLAQENIEEYELKKILIFRITHFIDWPENSKVNNTQNPIVISIIGENPFQGKLKKLAYSNRQKIKNKSVRVKYIHSIEEIDGSDILFISSSERYDISKIIKYARDKAILTFGDAKGFTEKGVMIGLMQRGETIKFYINKKETDLNGFYVSDQLLGNATKVIK